MNVLFEDNHVLVVEKPAGVLTQDSGSGEANLQDQAKAWIKERYHKPGAVFLHAVHRLDRPASGIVVFARTSKALSRLNEALRSKDTTKHYYAIVCGQPKLSQATLEHYMAHGDHSAKITTQNTPGALLARLSYQVIATTHDLTLVKIELETGRYHQIRLQLATIGNPILGDVRYGGQPWRQGEIALHHCVFTFPHPITKGRVMVTAAAPASWPLQPALESREAPPPPPLPLE